MLFEFVGEHIIQPRHHIFEKATRLAISQSSPTCFLTSARAPTEMARRFDLLSAHFAATNQERCPSQGQRQRQRRRIWRQRWIPLPYLAIVTATIAATIAIGILPHHQRASLIDRVPFYVPPIKVKAAKVERGSHHQCLLRLSNDKGGALIPLSATSRLVQPL